MGKIYKNILKTLNINIDLENMLPSLTLKVYKIVYIVSYPLYLYDI